MRAALRCALPAKSCGMADGGPGTMMDRLLCVHAAAVCCASLTRFALCCTKVGDVSFCWVHQRRNLMAAANWGCAAGQCAVIASRAGSGLTVGASVDEHVLRVGIEDGRRKAVEAFAAMSLRAGNLLERP